MKYNFPNHRSILLPILFLIVISNAVGFSSALQSENESTENIINQSADSTNQYVGKFAVYDFKSTLYANDQNSSLSGTVRYDIISYDKLTEKYTSTITSQLKSSNGEDFSNIETITFDSPKKLEIEKIILLIDQIIPGSSNIDISNDGASTATINNIIYKTTDSKYSITKSDLLGSQETSEGVLEPTLESKISGKLKVLESELPYSIEFQLDSADLVGIADDSIRDDVMLDFGQIVDTYKDMQFEMSMILAETNFELSTPVTSTPVTSTQNNSSKDGGCLIATATYGSELAPQVQQLRELRDNSLLQTESGKLFMSSFNDFYYSFSPTIADWERENPAFKEAVKITLTPMISTLSILNYVDMNSEDSVLGYGISLIILNVGMYFVAPAIVIVGIRKRF